MIRRLLVIPALCICLALAPPALFAASASSPRHSGIESPGDSQSSHGLPGKGMSRSPQGGRGYTDAYGNTIDDVQPEEKKARRRLNPGAYGHREEKKPDRPLPDPQTPRPLWSFQ